MSYNQYNQYGGNPYEQSSGGYGSANPYASDAGNPYGGGYGQAVRYSLGPGRYFRSIARTFEASQY